MKLEQYKHNIAINKAFIKSVPKVVTKFKEKQYISEVYFRWKKHQKACHCHTLFGGIVNYSASLRRDSGALIDLVPSPHIFFVRGETLLWVPCRSWESIAKETYDQIPTKIPWYTPLQCHDYAWKQEILAGVRGPRPRLGSPPLPHLVGGAGPGVLKSRSVTYSVIPPSAAGFFPNFFYVE